jgi:small subunit ribosomal protein S21
MPGSGSAEKVNVSRVFLCPGPIDPVLTGWKEVRSLATVVIRPNESQDQLLKRFRKKVAKSGILSTVRRKRWFVSKSELRRIQKKKAIRRIRRRTPREAEV